MSKLHKELCNRLSTTWKTFTLLYDVLIRISKYSQIYQNPKVHTHNSRLPNFPILSHTYSVHILTLYLVRLITYTYDNCQNTMSKLHKKLCNRLSTTWKTFTLPYDVLIRISKYSQIYQNPKFIPTTTADCPTSQSSATHTQSTFSHCTW